MNLSKTEAEKLTTINLDFFTRQGRDFILAHGDDWRKRRSGLDIEIPGDTLYKVKSTGEYF